MVTRPFKSLIINGFLLALAFMLVSILYSSDLDSPIRFLIKASYFHLTLILLTLSVCSVLFFKSRTALLSFALCLLLLAPRLALQLGANEKKRVVSPTYNIASFSAMTRTRNGADIQQWINSNDFDLICLQEVLAQDLPANTEGFHSTLNQNNPLVTLSKQAIKPIKSNGVFQISSTTLANTPTLVVNVHMPRQHKDKINKTYAAIFESLAEHKDKAVILCGDFNMTPYNSMYTLLTEQLGFIDSHKSVGSGFAFTFPNKNRRLAFAGTQVRIDYIFIKHLNPLNARTLNVSDASDHRAIEIQIGTNTL